MRIDQLTPVEAAQLAGVPAHRIEFDVRRHAKQITRIVAIDEKSGAVVTVSYSAADVIREFNIVNWRLKLALIELDRLLERKPRPRVVAIR